MSREERLYLFFVSLFCVVIVVSNFITPKLLLLGSVVIPAGLLTYPLTFLLGDFITEIYGSKHARYMIYLGFTMSIAACLIVRLSLAMPGFSASTEAAFNEIFSQNFIIVLASMIAYIVAQLADVSIYSFLRGLTRNKYLWLRSNGSTLIAQALDTLIVTSITFMWGFGYNWENTMPIIISSYLYKATFSIGITPFYYLMVYLAKKQLKVAKSDS